jgi:hypothetical protein
MLVEIISLISFLIITSIIISYLRFSIFSNLEVFSYRNKIKDDFANSTLSAFTFFIIALAATGVAYAARILTWENLSIIISSIAGISIGISLHPLFLYKLIKNNEEKRIDKIIDKKVLQVAIKYGGVVTISHLIFEVDLSIEEAYKALKRFVDAGEAYVKQSGNIRFWDFPSARAHLAKTDYEIIENLIESGGRTKKIELINKLISKYSWSIEGIEQAINRLEVNGILKYDRLTDELRLLGISIKD